MVTLIVVSAGYAAYQAHLNMSKREVELEEGLSREDKHILDFLPSELNKGMLRISLSTVTFCTGDCRRAAPILEERVKEIRKSNPWLSGFLAPPEGGGNIQLYYDPNPASENFQKTASSFKCFEPGEVPLTQMTPFKDYDEICQKVDVKVPLVDEVVGKNQPLWKVSIIPDAAEPDEKWILVVSMCRLLGDAQTFYMLYNQLSISQPVSALNAERKKEFHLEAAEKLGEKEFGYLKKLGEQKKGSEEEDGPLAALRSSISSHASRRSVVNEEPAHEVFVFRVAKRWMDQEKAANPDVEDEGSLVVSWFFRKIRPEILLLALTLRNLCRSVHEYDAGNYQTPIPMVCEDYDKPQGIQSSLTSGKRATSEEIELPQKPHSFGIASDWSRFGVAVEASPGSEDAALFEQTHHFPLMDAKDLLELPRNVCGVIIFNASKGQLGALCIVPRGMTEEFQGSGIMDNTIDNLAKMRYSRWLKSITDKEEMEASAKKELEASAKEEAKASENVETEVWV